MQQAVQQMRACISLQVRTLKQSASFEHQPCNCNKQNRLWFSELAQTCEQLVQCLLALIIADTPHPRISPLQKVSSTA
jgi:hypothetical protein